MTQQHENKILVGVVWIKWLSGIAAFMATGCMVFLWNMNAFRASTNSSVAQHESRLNRLEMDMPKIRTDLTSTHEDIVRLQDNKVDKPTQ